jgi:hypothetical protein
MTDESTDDSLSGWVGKEIYAEVFSQAGFRLH